jgi:hypothetical protein
MVDYMGTAAPWQWTVTNSGTNTTASVWMNWTAGTGSGTYQYVYDVRGPVAPPPRTSEQIEADRRALEDQRRRHRERAAARLEAEARAEDLLRECLNKEQAEQLERNHAFRVRGSRGGVYEIAHGVAYQINEERNRRSHSICIHGSGVPEPDNMLAKKLMIEADEERFRAIGNFSRYS